jgi:YMGG-like Gly-zipper
MRGTFLILNAVAGLLLANVVAAKDVYVYPSKGQSKEQQQRDEFECHKWAKEQSSFDPTAAQPGAATPPPRGGAVRGAARGAAVGAVGGAIGGNAGKGAAIGAGVGAAAGAVRRHRAARESEAAQQQANQQYAASRDGYDRAFAACMSGRGYTVQ